MKNTERVSLEERLLRKATKAFKARRRELEEDLDWDSSLIEIDEGDDPQEELSLLKQQYERDHALFN